MTIQYFGVRRGINIDGEVTICHGIGIPGTTPDTDAAGVGSIYMDTATGVLYTKTSAGAGTARWTSETSSGKTLYSESANALTAAPPSATAENSVAIGAGAQTDPSAIYSLAVGDQSLSRTPYSIVMSGGRFQTTGDAQAGRYLVRTVTVNQFPTECFLDGTNGQYRIVLPDDCTWSYSIHITAHRTDSNDGHAGFHVAGVVHRGAGPASIALQGRPIKSILSRSNSSWDINITTDPTHGALRVNVTGEAGKIIRWLAVVDTVEVTN